MCETILTWLDVDCSYLGKYHVVAEDSSMLAGRALHPLSTDVAIKSYPLSIRCLGLACRQAGVTSTIL